MSDYNPACARRQEDFHKFLNYGYKTGDTRELSKLKVDVLGQVLKKHVSQLRSGKFIISFFTKNKLWTTM